MLWARRSGSVIVILHALCDLQAEVLNACVQSNILFQAGRLQALAGLNLH